MSKSDAIRRIFGIAMVLVVIASTFIGLAKPVAAATVPTVETRPATLIVSTVAMLNGRIVSDGGSSILERRFSWGTTPSCSDGWTSTVGVAGDYFSYDLMGLNPGTTYYFQSWARNSVGWANGAAVSFTTQATVIAARIDSYSPNDPNNPARVTPSSSVTLSVTFTNTGNTAWNFIAGTTIWDSGGVIVGDYSQTLSSALQPGQQTTVNFSHTVNNPGDYWVQFGVWKATPFTSGNLLDKEPSPSQRLIVGCYTPTTPGGPSPGNGATGVSISTSLSWSASSYATSYDVYFGTSASPPCYGSTSNTSYSLPTLSYNTPYYWQIIAKNSCGAASGPVWNFTTESPTCATPGTPSNPSPATHVANVPISTTLQWSACTNTDSYDVYFGTSSSPPYYATTSTSSYSPALSYSTTYYWRIVAKNNCGGATSGSTWDFTTAPSPGQVVSFPDPNLQIAIREAIGKPTGDIHQSDLVGLTTLSAENRGIIDLTGLEYCSSLAYLALDYNQISNISPLSGLTSLTYLYLNSNQISNISPLSGLTSLLSLYLDSNQISNISPLSGLTSLIHLSLGYNQISNISPLSSLTSLTYLYLNSNQISNISPLSGLTSLYDLDLYSNQISNISPLAGLTNLTWLGLYSNQISNISPLSGLTSLYYLSLYSNQISNISPLAGLTNLTWLGLYSNQISNISPLSGLTSLIYLGLYSNQISDIEPLVNNAGLSTGDIVSLTSNPLSTTSVNVYIPQLQARGVTVYFTQPTSTPTPTPSTDNRAPNSPVLPFQWKSDSVTAILVGTPTSETTVIFNAVLSDPDLDKVSLQIELRRVDEYAGGFIGIPTQQSELVSSASIASITASGLVPGAYHWQARCVDQNSLTSDWVSFGNNSDSESDFSVVATPQNVVSGWKLFAQDYQAHMEKWAPLYFFVDAVAAETAASALFIPVPDPVRLSIIIAYLVYSTGKGVLDVYAAIMADPPREDFQEVAAVEPVTPVTPYDNSTLAHARAALATTLLRQSAILEAVVVSLERLQGAEQANEPTYVALQATALRDLSLLLMSNQQELSEALTLLGTEFVAAVAPVYDKMKGELARLSVEGLSPEERQLLQEVGLSLDEIQALDDIFQSVQMRDDFHIEVAAAAYQTANWIDETVLPDLELGVVVIDALLNSIESIPNTPVGSDVSVTLPGAVVTFASVTAEGVTTVITQQGNPGGGIPSGFRVRGLFVDITTTATYTGNIAVGISYDPSTPNPQNLKLFHSEGGHWVDVTTSVDTVNHIVYGEVSTFSWFFIGGQWVEVAGAPVPVFPNIYIGIAAALGAGVLAYFVRRRLLRQA